MAETAAMIQYRQEYIAGFEQRASMFATTASTEFVKQGNQAYFLVASSGGASAVTRGVNGLIPGRADSLTQTAVTLTEWHDKPVKTGFNVFESQGDQRRIMQENSAGVIYRKIDSLLITALSAATNDTGTALPANVKMFNHGMAILGRNDVPIEEENNMFCAISPAARAYLMETTQFASGEYVDVKPYNGPARKFWRWNGCNYFVSNKLSGIGTSAEKCLMWHRSAIGYAANAGDVSVGVGYNDEHDYYYARTTLFGGAGLLQNGGIVVINHDGSAYEAS